MSCRGRKKAPRDTYPTPAWCTRLLLRTVPLPPGRWLEPAAGAGAIMRAVSDVRSDVCWTAVEIDRNLAAQANDAVPPDQIEALYCRDFLDRDFQMHLGPGPGPFDVVVANPPYGGLADLARQFVQTCMPIANTLCFLLRLNWIAGGGRPDARSVWLSAHMPERAIVMAQRPSFDGKGTDGAEYAWFVWRRPFGRTDTRLQVVRCIPWDHEGKGKD